MKIRKFNKIKPGLYRIYWKEKHGGGQSLAAVGVSSDGTKWIAPTNWIYPSLADKKIVKRISRIVSVSKI